MARRIAAAVCWIGVLNFAACALVAILIGGEAATGTAVGGRYFVGMHGGLTEVSYPVYLYSSVHVASVFLSLPFVAGCALWLSLTPKPVST